MRAVAALQVVPCKVQAGGSQYGKPMRVFLNIQLYLLLPSYTDDAVQMQAKLPGDG
jgi:hypothetical protein